VHIERLVRIFTRIFGRFGNVDLIEFDLTGTFATQVFVSNAAAAHMPLGQTSQAVGLGGLDHIALQHGVMLETLHFDAVVGKHMAVVFNMLAQFGFGRVFKPGFKPGQHLLQRQLLRRARIVMG